MKCPLILVKWDGIGSDEGHNATALEALKESILLLQGRVALAFGRDIGEVGPSVDIKALHAKIGELTLKNVFLESALTKAGLLSAKK